MNLHIGAHKRLNDMMLSGDYFHFELAICDPIFSAGGIHLVLNTHHHSRDTFNSLLSPSSVRTAKTPPTSPLVSEAAVQSDSMLPANALLSQVDASQTLQTHSTKEHHSIISSLPPEIMSAIFIYCLPTERFGRNAVNFAEAPLLLSRVCSRWRQIALSTAALWQELDIRLRRRQVANIVEAWLARARNYPLSVTFQCPARYLIDSTKFYETFRRHASGMQSLELEGIDSEDWRIAGPIEFPLLRNLSIMPSVGIFRIAPHLSQVHLERIPTRAVALPWQQLQKFTAEFYELSDCLDALQLMPNLVECAFSVFCASLPERERLLHSHIRSLTLFKSKDIGISDEQLEEDDFARSAQLLDYITFPNLESLELDELNVEFDVGPVPSFLERGPPPLERLVLRPGPGRCTILPLSVAPLLQHHLTDLEIWNPTKDFATRFFERFGHDSRFVPGLEKLVFYCDNRRKEVERNQLLEIAGGPLTSRGHLAGVGQLQVFHAVACQAFGDDDSPPSEGVFEPFRRLKEDGVDVYIGTRGSWGEVGKEKWTRLV
ncbi:hypothetical protein FB45DRAFT_1055353 [Roridomyces roridus]|uniref:F-box domain-containing protein n=1 Tax=Roridomyces roridus TaxID=1738132 RepID=A0AAD7C5F6_9AGAR|nr:hypothetical protein FB45DRAFT_1055353 [Roridomyces roridus]